MGRGRFAPFIMTMVLIALVGTAPILGGTLRQQATELASRMVVLNVSVRPGSEDFGTLAYFRSVRGATIVSLYITNGEAGENDLEGMVPRQLAATRRLEAHEAIRMLDGEAMFLNFPDVVSASTSRTVTDLWVPDSLRLKITAAVQRYKPDVILLSRDRFCVDRPIWHNILEHTIEAAIHEADSVSIARWKTERFLVERVTGEPLTVPANRIKNINTSYPALADSAAGAYRSLYLQRSVWQSETDGRYALAWGARPLRRKAVDADLPPAAGRALRPLARRIESLAAALQLPRVDVKRSLGRAATLIASVSTLLSRNRALDNRERRDLLLWKGALESIQNTLLGVRVAFKAEFNIITDRQMVNFTIDSVAGATPDGSTDLYVPAVERGWILNEASIARLPLHAGESYRLVSPPLGEYDLPFQESGLERQTIGHPLYVFIIHKASSREHSFVYRIIHPLQYAPRFTAEVLTPIVAMVPRERLAVRLTNHSRDGIRDTIGVGDSRVPSASIPFRLSEKGAQVLDTLTVSWADSMKDGTYLFPLEIGGVPVARFGARKFSCSVDTTRQISVVSGTRNSPLLAGLRRLGCPRIRLIPPGSDVPPGQQDNVLFVDRQTFLFYRDFPGRLEALLGFAESGGHLIVCPQNAAAWNASPFASLFSLREDNATEAADSIRYEDSSRVMRSPNRIEPGDFDGFIFRRNHNLITGASSGVLAWDSATGNPLIISLKMKKGRVTYIDLALDAQLLNIHPGVHRLLANFISLPSGDGQ